MKKDSIIDYLGFILFKLLAPVIRILPKRFSLFLGRRIGDLLYYFDLKHKAIAYSNIKIAFGDSLGPNQLSKLTHEFYRCFGQNFIEIFFIPLVDKRYFDKYIRFEGLENIKGGFKGGKGLILLAVHAGSWELSNMISGLIGFPFSLFVRDQGKAPHLNKLLNSYRRQKGSRLIERESQTRQLIESLKKNEAIGMTVDQGGEFGMSVRFFGRQASMATGAVRLALQYGTAIVPAYYTRLKGPYIKVILEKPFEVIKTGDEHKDIKENLQRLTFVFEKLIKEYPYEYMWSYKIWKYSKEKNILILDDGKAGHLRQSEAVAKIAANYFSKKNTSVSFETIEVKFKNKISRAALTILSSLSGKYRCQGCLVCLRKFLDKQVYKSLLQRKPDVVISCGSSVAPVNYLISRENVARSIAIMRPSILSTNRFDLVIMPKHDNPQKGKKILVTEGALNLIDDEYLMRESEKLIQKINFKEQGFRSYIGVLIGGDTKKFHLTREIILEAIIQIKEAAENLDMGILITTSRRTKEDAENIIKLGLKDYPRTKLLIVANEGNIPEAVGGILGLSDVLICSPESISMISEAVNSKKYVFVFKAGGLDKKHLSFLDLFAEKGYIYLTKCSDLSKKIQEVLHNKPAINALADNSLIEQAIKKIL